MKLTSDDAYYALNQVIDAANLLEISLSNAKRLLEREEIKAAAAREGIPLATFMRWAALKVARQAAS